MVVTIRRVARLGAYVSFLGSIAAASAALAGDQPGGAVNEGGQDIHVLPKGSPIKGSLASFWTTIAFDRPVQNYGVGLECTGSAAAPRAGGNVCEYVWHELGPTSGQGWGRNVVVQAAPSFRTSAYSMIGDEIDINNLAADYNRFAATNSVGLLLNGVGYMQTAAVSVQTGNTDRFKLAGRLALWFYGFHCGDEAIGDACFHDASNARASIAIGGRHDLGIDLADADTTGAALRLGDHGPTQGIVVRTPDGDRPALYADAPTGIHLGGPVRFDGAILPSQSGQQPLGASDAMWADIAVRTVNGVPPSAAGTPSSSHASCVPGQIMMDAKYHYDCIATGHWRRFAFLPDRW